MPSLSRRGILGAGGALLSTTLVKGAFGQSTPAIPHEPFSFLFITDTHLQPELDAMKGCQMAFGQPPKNKQILSCRVEITFMTQWKFLFLVRISCLICMK